VQGRVRVDDRDAFVTDGIKSRLAGLAEGDGSHDAQGAARDASRPVFGHPPHFTKRGVGVPSRVIVLGNPTGVHTGEH
jgi:hypothetical protein